MIIYVNGVRQELTEEETVSFESYRNDINFLNPVPLSVSRMQLLQALVLQEFITPDEALNSNTTVPTSIEALVSNLTVQEQLAVKLKWMNFSEAYRNDSLVLALQAANNMTDAELDDFFRLAGSL